MEAARRESAQAEAEIWDLRQEMDRVQSEGLEAKFSLKKLEERHEREKATCVLTCPFPLAATHSLSPPSSHSMKDVS